MPLPLLPPRATWVSIRTSSPRRCEISKESIADSRSNRATASPSSTTMRIIPTEIRATLSAAKSGNFRRIFAVFQPHRYTRTFHFFDDFARAFNLADVVLILDIYPAGEAPIEGITTPALIEKIKSFGHKNAMYAPTFEMIESYITANARRRRCRRRDGRRQRHETFGHALAAIFEDCMKLTWTKLVRFVQICRLSLCV